MAQKQEFRISTGLVVATPGGGEGNITGGIGKFTTSLSTESLSTANFSPADMDLTGHLTVAGPATFNTALEGLSADGINLTNDAGDVGLGTLDAATASITTTAPASATIYTIPTSQYRSGKIVIQAVSVGVGTDPPASMETSEILFIQGWDGYNITVDWCEYATVGIGSTSIVTYTAVVVGDNVEFRATNNHSQTINFVSSISQLYTITTALT